jgi:hypothetical protein
MLQKCFVTLPQICTLTQCCLGALRTIPSPSWLGFCSDMPCQLCDLYIDRCVPFQITSNQLNLPQVDSIKLEKHLKDDQWKQAAPELNFEYHSKGSEYLCTVNHIYFYKPVFTLSLWGIVCRLLRIFI